MTFLDGLANQLRVIRALILRETRTRFGAHYLGYLWAFLEPLFWIGTFAVLYAIAARKAPPGLDIVDFLATGVLTYLVFRQTSDRSVRSITSNSSLLFYPQIRPLDLVASRSILEIATLGSVFVVLTAANALYRQSLQLDSLLHVMTGFILAGLLGASLGLTLCALSTFSKVVQRLISPLMRPLFWTSGLFFCAADLPRAVRDVLLWNPVLHCTEHVREGFFPSYNEQYANLEYVVAWIVGLALFGLTAERAARRRLEV
jgi:capsular polysaccharide transport system permease protein